MALYFFFGFLQMMAFWHSCSALPSISRFFCCCLFNFPFLGPNLPCPPFQWPFWLSLKDGCFCNFRIYSCFREPIRSYNSMVKRTYYYSKGWWFDSLTNKKKVSIFCNVFCMTKSVSSTQYLNYNYVLASKIIGKGSTKKGEENWVN